MHAQWPFAASTPYHPGAISASTPELGPGGFPSGISSSAEAIHHQALLIEERSHLKNDEALELRTRLSEEGSGEMKAELLERATRLEEEAEALMLEAGRLRGESVHLDGELAKELDHGMGSTWLKGGPAGVRHEGKATGTGSGKVGEQESGVVKR